MVSIGALFSFIFHICVKESSYHSLSPYQAIPSHSDDPSAALLPQAEASPPAAGRMRSSDWFRQRQFYVVGLLYMSTRLFCNISQAYMPIYLQETLALQPASVAYIPLTMYISGFVTTTAIKPLNKYLGRKVKMSVGNIQFAGGLVAIKEFFFIPMRVFDRLTFEILTEVRWGEINYLIVLLN